MAKNGMGSNQDIDVKTWLKNFTRSIGYTAKDLISSELLPETSSQVNTLKEAASEAKDVVSEKVQHGVRAIRTVDRSSTGKKLVNLYKDMLRDARTGNFSTPLEFNFDNLDVDMEFETTSFLDEESGEEYEEVVVSNDAKLTSHAIVMGTNITTSAMNEMAKSLSTSFTKAAKFQSDSSKAITLIATNAITHEIAIGNQHLSQIESNSAKILTWLVENQSKVNAQHLTHMQDVKEALAMQMRLYSKTESTRQKSSSRILREGSFDMDTFIKNTKRNFSGSSIGMLTSLAQMIPMMGSMLGMGDSFNETLRPTAAIMKAGMKSLLPKNTMKQFQRLDRNILDAVNNSLISLGDHKNDGGILGLIAEMLGYDRPGAAKIRLGDYNKGATAWDGASKKALEEVIPHYLSVMTAALTNQERELYDYKSDRFYTERDAEAKTHERLVDKVQSNFRSADDQLDRMMKLSDGSYIDAMSDQKIRKQLQTDIYDNISRYLNPKKYGAKAIRTYDDLSANLAKLFKTGKYKGVFSSDEVQQITQQFLKATMKMQGGFGRDFFGKDITSDSSNAMMREIIRGGRANIESDEFGYIDFLKNVMSSEVMDIDTSENRYYKQRKQEAEERAKAAKERSDELLSRLGVTDSEGNLKGVAAVGKKMKDAREKLSLNGSKYDDTLASGLIVINQYVSGVGQTRLQDLENANGLKGIADVLRESAGYEDNGIGENGKTIYKSVYDRRIEITTLRKWLKASDLNIDWYNVVTYNSDDTFAYARAKINTHTNTWPIIPRYITPDMFVNGVLDRDKVLAHGDNAVLKESEAIQHEIDITNTAERNASRKSSEASVRNAKHQEKEADAQLRAEVKNNLDSSSDSDNSEGNGPAGYGTTRKTNIHYDKVVDNNLIDNKATRWAIRNATEVSKQAAVNVSDHFTRVGEKIYDKIDRYVEEKFFGNKDTEIQLNHAVLESGKALADKEKKDKKLKKYLGGAAATVLGIALGKKVINKKGLGMLAMATSIAGPVGVGLAALGAGIVATKIDFKRLLFGDKQVDDKGNIIKTKEKKSYFERIFDNVKSAFVDPIKNSFKNFGADIKAYFKATMSAPLKRAFSPLAEGLKSIGDDIKEKTTNAFKKVLGFTEKAAINMLGGTGSAAGKLVSGLIDGAKGIATGGISVGGVFARYASRARKKRDYNKIGKWIDGDHGKKQNRSAGQAAVRNIVQPHISALSKLIAESQKPDSGVSREDVTNQYQASMNDLKQAYEGTKSNENPDGNPVYQVAMDDLTEAYEDYANKQDYYNQKAKSHDNTLQMKKKRKLYSKTGGDLGRLSDQKLVDAAKDIQADLQSDDQKKLFEKVLETQDRNLIEMLIEDPDKAAKVLDQREAAKKAEEEAAAQRAAEEAWRNALIDVEKAQLEVQSMLLNQQSMGAIPYAGDAGSAEQVQAKIIGGEVNEAEYAEKNAEATSLQSEQAAQLIDKHADENNEQAAESAAKISEEQKEADEDAATENQGKKESRFAKLKRKIKDLFAPKEEKNGKGEKEKSGGILSFITDGLKSLFTNPLVIGAVGLGLDALFNNGQVTKFLIDALGSLCKLLIGKIDDFFGLGGDHGVAEENLIGEDGESITLDEAKNRYVQTDVYGNAKRDKNGNPLVTNSSRREAFTNAVGGTALRGAGKLADKVIDSGILNPKYIAPTGNIELAKYAAGKPNALDGSALDSGVNETKTSILGGAATAVGNKIIGAGGAILRGAGGAAGGVAGGYLGGKAAMALAGEDNKAAILAGTAIGGVGGYVAGKELTRIGLNTIGNHFGGAASSLVSESTVGNMAKSALNGAKAVGSAVATGVTKLWGSMTTLLTNIVKTLPESQTLSKLLGPDRLKSCVEFLDKHLVSKLTSINEKLLEKFAPKITEAAAEESAETAAKAIPGINLVIIGVQAAWGGITGALDAANLFQVAEDDVDGLMRGVSALLKAFFAACPGAGFVQCIMEIFDALTGSNLMTTMASGLYGVLADIGASEADKGAGKDALAAKQAEFDAEYQAYLKENGITEEDVSKDAYNDMRNTTTGTKIWNAVTNPFKQAWGWITGNGGKDNENSEESAGSGPSYPAKVNNLQDGPAGYGFSQSDPRWANLKTGHFKNGSEATMKTAGCGFTALADADRLLGGHSTPDQVAKTAMSRGDVAEGGAKASLFEKGINGVKGTKLNDAKSMEASLKQGKPVVISGQSAGYGPGEEVFPSTNKHLVTAKGMDNAGNVIIDNPMKGEQKVPFGKLASQTKAAWSMSKAAGYGMAQAYAVNDGGGGGGSNQRSKRSDSSANVRSGPPGDVANEDYVYYKQQDPQWKNVQHGPGIIIDNTGCINTSVAMATSMLRGDKVDPGDMATNVFYPTSTNNGLTGNTWPKLNEVYGIESENFGGGQAGMEKAVEYLKEGKPVDLHGSPNVNAAASWSGKIEKSSPQHSILAYGIDGDGNLLIADPSDYSAGRVRGEKTAAHIAPGDLVNGLRWARGFSKDGKGVASNVNMSAIANMQSSGNYASGSVSSSSSSSSEDSNDGTLSGIFSKLATGISSIAGNALDAFISGKSYERAIDEHGNPIKMNKPMDGSTGSSSNSSVTSAQGIETSGKSDSGTELKGVPDDELEARVKGSNYYKHTGKDLQKYDADFNPSHGDELLQDLGSYKYVDAEKLNKYIGMRTHDLGKDDSVFKGKGADIVQAANKTGLDPRYILAHAAYETAWGTSYQAKEKNNFFGIDSNPDNPASGASFTGNGFEQGAEWIGQNFYDVGQKNLAGMLVRDPKHPYSSYDLEHYGFEGPNFQWANQIANTMGNMKSCGFGPGESATVTKGLDPLGIGTKSKKSESPLQTFDTKMDTVINLLSEIATNTKESNSGSGFVDNSGYGSGPSSVGEAKKDINTLRGKNAAKDFEKTLSDSNSKPQGDLGRTKLKAIHNAIATGYRGI